MVAILTTKKTKPIVVNRVIISSYAALVRRNFAADLFAEKYVTFHRKKVLPTCGKLREIPTTFPQLSHNFPETFPKLSRISQPAISRIPQLATCIFRFLHGGIYEIYET